MKYTILLIFTLYSFMGFAQQYPNIDDYRFNPFAINPAVAGYKNCNNMNIGYKSQWMGIEGAPTLGFLTVHTRLNKSQRSPKNIQGFGFFLAQESEGIFQSTYFKLAYSYHYALSRNYEASVGVFVGAQKKTYGSLDLQTPAGMFDPAFDESKSQYIIPEISPGIFIKGSKLFVGLSVMQIYPVKYKKIFTSETNLSPHFNLMGGFEMGKYSWKFTPSFLLTAVPKVPPTLDVSISADYRDKFLVALGGKYANSIYFSFHLRLLKWLKAAYTYSFPISPLSKVAHNTQSFGLSISGCDSFTERPEMYCPVFK